MRSVRLLLVAFASLFILNVAAVPYAAAAYDSLSTVCSSAETRDSPTCGSRTTTNPLTGSNGLLMKITLVIAAIAGFTAILVILIAGSRYMTASGDPKKAADARNALIGALVGLVIISFATLIIMFIVNGIK